MIKARQVLDKPYSQTAARPIRYRTNVVYDPRFCTKIAHILWGNCALHGVSDCPKTSLQRRIPHHHQKRLSYRRQRRCLSYRQDQVFPFVPVLPSRVCALGYPLTAVSFVCQCLCLSLSDCYYHIDLSLIYRLILL